MKLYLVKRKHYKSYPQNYVNHYDYIGYGLLGFIRKKDAVKECKWWLKEYGIEMEVITFEEKK